jgi:hypothetical protein
MGFEILVVVAAKSTVILVVVLCSLEKALHFRRTLSVTSESKRKPSKKAGETDIKP